METYVAIITVITGLIGTVGGLIISYVSLKHTFDQSKHMIAVSLDKSLLVGLPGVDSKKQQFTIMVANLGLTEYTVAGLTIGIGRNSGGLFIAKPTGTHQIPAKLKRDETCTFWTDYDGTVEDIKKMTKRSSIKIRAIVKDYAGTKFYSDWYRLQLKNNWRSKLRDSVVKIYKFIKQRLIP